MHLTLGVQPMPFEQPATLRGRLRSEPARAMPSAPHSLDL
jgi:hypothetical protein